MRLHFTGPAWEDYLHWQATDPNRLRRLNELIRDCMRQPFRGLGKPEPLKGDLAGWWSRRIDDEHRLVYRVAGSGEESLNLLGGVSSVPSVAVAGGAGGAVSATAVAPPPIYAFGSEATADQSLYVALGADEEASQ